ncbi:hypothetical protein C2G38_515521 [Gigaspora rosea]|uniref:Uncharacterized protein n=1 Tax=Gigaspora rosea TaxID=44941 RepID=A0A397U873_9GLOM|nr:hypothetical protein C2G38_515521 [Gigaspora rosea]
MINKIIIILVTFLFKGVLSENETIFQTPGVLTISYIKDQPNFPCIMCSYYLIHKGSTEFSMYYVQQMREIGVSLLSRSIACDIQQIMIHPNPLKT